MQEPLRVGSLPVAICSEAIVMTRDVFVAAVGLWAVASRVMAEATTWPNQRVYAGAAADYVKDARRVIDALRAAAEDDRDVFGDPLASSWDDVVRNPHAMEAISPFASVPFEERRGGRAPSG
jgi:hypothetical protein